MRPSSPNDMLTSCKEDDGTPWAERRNDQDRINPGAMVTDDHGRSGRSGRIGYGRCAESSKHARIVPYVDAHEQPRHNDAEEPGNQRVTHGESMPDSSGRDTQGTATRSDQRMALMRSARFTAYTNQPQRSAP